MDGCVVESHHQLLYFRSKYWTISFLVFWFVLLVASLWLPPLLLLLLRWLYALIWGRWSSRWHGSNGAGVALRLVFGFLLLLFLFLKHVVDGREIFRVRVAYHGVLLRVDLDSVSKAKHEWAWVSRAIINQVAILAEFSPYRHPREVGYVQTWHHRRHQLLREVLAPVEEYVGWAADHVALSIRLHRRVIVVEPLLCALILDCCSIVAACHRAEVVLYKQICQARLSCFMVNSLTTTPYRSYM